MNNLTTSIATFLAVLLLATCGRQPQYPQQLVEADSAMRWGQYDQADSLLQAYEKASKTKKNATHRYYQLLTLESKFLRDESSLDDLLLADSLRTFYESSSKEKHAKVLAILGDIYFASSDYPSALESFLKAEEEAEQAGELWWQGITSRTEGDVYRKQRMFSEMTDYYIRSYHIATTTRDTLRMAYAAISMGKVYTILNNPDSTIYFYEKAIELGKDLEQSQNIIPYAKSALADIYLQLEEFSKAAAIMPHDSLNDVNWGYWHYLQNYQDSALYYFTKSYKKYGHNGQADLLKILAQIEFEKRDFKKSINYFRQSIEHQDSVIELSQVEATKKVEAQYNLNLIRRALDKSEEQKKLALFIDIILLLVLLTASVIFTLSWAYIRKKREEDNTYEKMLRLQMEQKKRISKEQMEYNQSRIQELEEELKEARRKSDDSIIQKLTLNTEKLAAENEQIKAISDSHEQLEKQWKQSELYKRIIQKAGTPDFVLSDEEWKDIGQNIDVVYDNFTYRLQELTKLSEIERQLCYLIKMELRPSAIAEMLRRQKGSITMARKRLGKKILRRDCTAEDFDAFILNF